MEEREQLLNNLYEAKKIISQAEEITKRYNIVKSRLKEYKQFIPAGSDLRTKISSTAKGVGTGILLFFLAMITLSMFLARSFVGMKMVTFWFMIFIVAIMIVVIKAIRNQKYYEEVNRNRQITVQKQNEEIAAFNLQINKEAEKINMEMQEIREIAAQRLYKWYPETYCYTEAVDFFINMISRFPCRFSKRSDQ